VGKRSGINVREVKHHAAQLFAFCNFCDYCCFAFSLFRQNKDLINFFFHQRIKKWPIVVSQIRLHKSKQKPFVLCRAEGIVPRFGEDGFQIDFANAT